MWPLSWNICTRLNFRTFIIFSVVLVNFQCRLCGKQYFRRPKSISLPKPIVNVHFSPYPSLHSLHARILGSVKRLNRVWRILVSVVDMESNLHNWAYITQHRHATLYTIVYSSGAASKQRQLNDSWRRQRQNGSSFAANQTDRQWTVEKYAKLSADWVDLVRIYGPTNDAEVGWCLTTRDTDCGVIYTQSHLMTRCGVTGPVWAPLSRRKPSWSFRDS